MDSTFLPAGNPVLTRELRVVLRNARTFAMLAIYVSLLGAIVMSQFPAGQSVSVEGGRADMGRSLFMTFFGAQVLLVLVMVPGLATGALAQERERRTLEPLLLTPMTPLGIVWGKASGVLALAGLLLLATLPLTSLCFLLGGVSPAELASAYAVLLGLSLFTTGLGLYCASKWQSTTQATMLCYAYLPILLMLIIIFSFPGMFVSGLLIIGWLFYRFAVWWRARGRNLPKSLAVVWELLLWIIEAALGIGLLYWMIRNYEVGVMVVGVLFLASYLFMVAYGILREAAREVAQKPAPVGPMRERLQDFKEEWQRAVSVPETVYLPAPTGPYSYSPIAPQSDPFAALGRDANAPLPGMTQAGTTQNSTTQTGAPTNVPPGVPPIVQPQGFQQTMPPVQPYAPPGYAPRPAKKETQTYGVEPFLADNLNPIYAKDMRTGLLGKAHYFFRFAYATTILTELLLLAFVWFDASSSSFFDFTGGWATGHLILLLTAGAWFGARGLAPEREQQTLPQLLTIPMPSSAIIGGKMMAVMTYTLYVFLMAVPLMLLLPMLGELPWGLCFTFLGLEVVFGAFAASWGLFCSIQCVTVRRALGWSLGGILVMLLGGPLIRIVLSGLSSGTSVADPMLKSTDTLTNLLLPLPALHEGLMSFHPSRIAPGMGSNIFATGAVSAPWLPSEVTLATLMVYGVATVILLFITARAFKEYAQTV